MAEPLSTGATAGTVAGWGIIASAFVGFVTSVDYGIAFGAFAGSVFFVVRATNLTRKQVFGYFVFGYAAGIFGAGVAADVMERVTAKYGIAEDKPLDALAAILVSTAAVQGYFWLENGGLAKLLPYLKKWVLGWLGGKS